MGGFKFGKKDFILYLLSKIEPEKCNKIRLMKVAFFVEFGYYFKLKKELSDAQYAAITLGPVIDGYSFLLTEMEKDGLVTVDGNTVRPLVAPKVLPPSETTALIDPIIEKYSSLSNSELIELSHMTDSFLITTNNDRILGKLIDKDLALLESFFADGEEDDLEEDKLPLVTGKLVKYESGSLI